MDRKRFVIIMAAGSGTRMGADRPKQFIELEGKAILQRTIEVFVRACPGIKVITVLPPDHVDVWKEYCLKNNFTCPQVLVKGGITRFHSVRNALERCRKEHWSLCMTEYVLSCLPDLCQECFPKQKMLPPVLFL